MSKEDLRKWWLETNGSGTATCPTCTTTHVCAWHTARLTDLLNLFELQISGSWKDGYEKGWGARKENTSEQLSLSGRAEKEASQQIISRSTHQGTPKDD